MRDQTAVRISTGEWLALSAAASLGLTTTLARLSYDGGTAPMTVLFLRGLAAALLVAYILSRRGISLRPARPAWASLLSVGLASAGVSIGLLGSVFFIPVSLAIVIFYIFPLIVAGLAPLLEGTRLGWRQKLAFPMAFCGLAMALAPAVDVIDWRGLALALGAAASSVALFFSGMRAMRHVKPLMVTFSANVVSLPIFVVAAMLLGSWALPHTPLGWTGLAGGVVCFAVALILQFAAMARIGSARTALLFNIEPLIALAAAAVILGERLGVVQYVGGGLVMAALLLAAPQAETRVGPA